MRIDTELSIIQALLTQSDFMMKYGNRLKPEFFDHTPEIQAIFGCITYYYSRYNKAPTAAILEDKLLPVRCDNKPTLIKAASDCLTEILSQERKDDFSEHLDFIIDETKKFIKKKTLENTLCEVANLVTQKKIDDAVNLVLEKINKLNFDDDLGLEYFADTDLRVDRLKEHKTTFPTGLVALDNLIGGWHKKTLNVFAAPTNAGKTMILGAMAANLLPQGKNGLYITLEINDFLLGNRIDANITDIAMRDLTVRADDIGRIIHKKKKDMEDAGSPYGRLIIKEYPPGYLNAQMILSYVRELEIKKQFKPDFIVIDYLGLMIPNGKAFSDNTYGKMKSVSEELRAVAVVLDLPVFTAVQTNRASYGEDTEPGTHHIADSMGIAHTADLILMVIRNEELNRDGQMKWVVAKSRMSKKDVEFLVKADYDHMRISDVTDSQATNVGVVPQQSDEPHDDSNQYLRNFPGSL